MAFFVFVVLVVALWALLRSEGAERRVLKLTLALNDMQRRLAALEAGEKSVQAMAPPPVEAPAPPQAASPAVPQPAAPPAAPLPAWAQRPTVAPTPKPAKPSDRPSLEQALGTRWLVWLGALAVALAGVFLAKYAVDQGLLGPAVRLTLGVLFGAALVVAGDILRHKAGRESNKTPLSAASIPAALTAAGLAIAFACVYAAHALHGLIGAATAFVGLAALAGAAFLLALRHGISDGRPAGAFIALLGLCGGLGVPALVSSDQPSAWVLFGYLAVLNTAALTVGWRLPARWLGLPVLAGAALWVITALGNAAPDLPIALFLVALSAVGLGIGLAPRHDGRPVSLADGLAAWGLGAVPAGLAWVLLAATDFSGTGLAALAVLTVLALITARRVQGLETLAPAAGLIAMLALIQGYTVSAADLSYAGRLAVAGGFGLMLAAAGLHSLDRADRVRQPALWAWTAALPLAALAWAGWAFDHQSVLPDIGWALLAAVLAGGAAVTAIWASRENRRIPGPFVAAGLLLAALALAALLRTAWLTAALSLLVPALALLENRVAAAGNPLATALRRGALAVALVALVRLTLNPWLLDYPLNGTSPVNWLLWGYGVPALATTAGAWLLQRRNAGVPVMDRPVWGLQATALVLALLFACLEIQVMQTGTLDQDPFGLLPTSLRTVLFLVAALALAGRPGTAPGLVARVGARVLVRIAAAQVVFLQLGVLNPLWSDQTVGPWPVLNLLLLVYGLPALLFAAVAWRQEQGLARRALGILVLVLAFVLLSLEVRQAFHGNHLSVWKTGGMATPNGTAIPPRGWPMPWPCWRWASAPGGPTCATPRWRCCWSRC